MSAATPAANPAPRSCEFGPIVVDYDDRVLTPRPWTFEQSRWAAELAATAAPGPILELCAGAGHIGLAAAVLAGRDLVQVEADPVAAGYATANAARATVRVEVRTGRLQTAVRPDERFPLVIADPPYLPTDHLARWPDDPAAAIDGGADGLDLVRDCLTVSGAHLSGDGWVLLQVAGEGQADEVDRLLAADPANPLRRAGLRVVDAERAVLLLRRC